VASAIPLSSRSILGLRSWSCCARCCWLGATRTPGHDPLIGVQFLIGIIYAALLGRATPPDVLWHVLERCSPLWLMSQDGV